MRACNWLGFFGFLVMCLTPLGILAADDPQPKTLTVPAVAGALHGAIARASPGETLILSPGQHAGPVTLTKPLTIDGQGRAEIKGNGTGSVIVATGEDIVIRGVIVSGSGNDHQPINSGILLTKSAKRVLVEDNRIVGNLHGITVHGARDAVIRSNAVIGRRDQRMNDRGNGIYVWNAPGTIIDGNEVRFGRDGIFSNYSKRNTFRNNVFRDLRFAVHYMYTNDSEVSGNVSVGNHLGYALMFSRNITVTGNFSLKDRTHGIMLNYANSSTVRDNFVRGGTHEKCVFIYNAHKNTIAGNRFEGCGVGIHFTAGSERNAITGNAFISNRHQVKYVGTKAVEWSYAGRGNFWSDHAAYDLDRNGLADGRFKPNDLMDHILWAQPAAKMLLGSPAVQLIRWSQQAFPALMPGGVVDSHPLMRPVGITVPEFAVRLERKAGPDWLEGVANADFDAVARY